MELSDSGLLAVEVKSSTSVKEKTWSNLLRFKERFSDRTVIGVCLQAGTRLRVCTTGCTCCRSPHIGSTNLSAPAWIASLLAIAWRIGGPDVYLHLGTPLAPRGIVQELQGASFRSSPGAPVATRSSKIVGSHHGRRVPARIPRPITRDELLEV